jgi:GT2 family glycosyltransferase
MENGSTQPETFAYYDKIGREPNTHVHSWEKPFNYSAINNEAVRRAQGQVVLLLNNDVQVINEDWIERMLEQALRPQVGAVGAKLYFPDDTIQHAGTLVGNLHGPDHVFAYAERGQAGYGNRLVVTQNLSAVTGACLMMRREVYEEVGGLDEDFAVAFNDVDLCLKVRQKGYLVLWTPHAELYHFESVTRGYNVDRAKRAFEIQEHDKFFAKWRAHLSEVDPYYTPNLNLSPPDGSLRI